MESKEKIILRRTTFTVTLRCTLRCRLCSADVINYVAPPHYSSEMIAKELSSYFEIVDYVEWLQYSGGEPFLNQELPQMIEEAMKYRGRFDKLMIFANGTVLPTDAMLSTFLRFQDKIHFFFSNYGNISAKAADLLAFFQKYNFSYTEKKYYGEDQHCGGWVDFGGWEIRNYSAGQLALIYEKCSMHTMGFTVVQEGQMHLCRKSYRGMELGAVDQRESDYLDIFDPSKSVREKREHLQRMLSLPYLAACDHCNATYGTSDTEKRMKPAEQIK